MVARVPCDSVQLAAGFHIAFAARGFLGRPRRRQRSVGRAGRQASGSQSAPPRSRNAQAAWSIPARVYTKSEPPPKPKEIETRTQKKFRNSPRKRRPITSHAHPRYLRTRPLLPRMPFPTVQGGAPALPYSQFTMNGATQGGMGFTGPGGGDFAGRFPAYVDAVRNRISSNWLQSTMDPSVRWAPRDAIYVPDPARRHGHERAAHAIQRQPFGGQLGSARHFEFEPGVGTSVELFREQRNRRVLV